MNKLLEAIEIERKAHNWDLELVLVDDGSKDKSFEKIEELSKIYPYIKGIKLSKNFGHQIAVKTAMHHSTGDYIAVIDDDLQDPPSQLPGFFKYLDDGYDVAYGIRKNRKESFLKRLAYNGFYKVLKAMSDIHIPIDSGDFCVMKKQVLDNMLKLQEQNPFLRGIRAWVGFKQIGVEFERHARFDGKSGYTLKKCSRVKAPPCILNAWYSPSTTSSIRLRKTPVVSFANNGSQCRPQITLMTFQPAPRKMPSNS